jgi:DeoR/GlpR family transcriptional regulator of sugar metabolism
MSMLKNERQKQLLEIIHKEKVVAIADLCKRLDVSHMTIWRDLDQLADAGLIERIRGGAMVHEYPDFNFLGTHTLDQDPQAALKSSIGRYAAHHFVSEGDFITVEAGSTASSLVPFLLAANVTVLTNGLLTSLLAYRSNIEINLICSGGVLIETGAFTGPQVEDFFNGLRVSKAFLGAAGLTINDGFTDPTPLYLRIKKAMINNADQIIMMLDSSKIGLHSLLEVTAFENIDILVTDVGISDQMVSDLKTAGIEVHIADLV